MKRNLGLLSLSLTLALPPWNACAQQRRAYLLDRPEIRKPGK